MEKTYSAKSNNSIYKSLGIKAVLILAFIWFLSSIYPIGIEAVQVQPKENIDLLDQDSDIPLIDKLKHYLNIGSYSSVLETIATLSEKEKNKAEIISIKAAALIGKDDFASARNEFNLLKNRTDTFSQHFSIIANMLLLKKKPSAAMMVCQSGLMRNRKSAKLLYQMGYAYNSLGKTRTALAYYKGAKSANDVSREIKQETDIEKAIAVAYYKLNDLEKAKNALKSNDLKDADSGILLIINAKYHASKGNFDKAISLLDKPQKSTRYLETALAKAQILILNSKPNEAIDLLNDLKLLVFQSNLMGSAEMIKSLAYLLINRPKESLTIIDSIKLSDNKIGNNKLVKSTIQVALGDKQSAIQALKEAPMPFSEMSTHDSLLNHLQPPALGTIFGLAYFCLDQGFYRQTIEIVKDAMTKTPNNIFLHFLLAESYRRTEKYKMALSEFKHITQLMPKSYGLRLFLSKAYDAAGMQKEALKNYAELSTERPDFLLAQLAHGGLLERFGKWDKARATYELSLNFDPDSVHLLTALGWVLTQLQDFEALTPILRTLKANSKTRPALIWHLEGWGAYKRKDFPKAVELLTKAMDATPGDPETCYHLGMALYSSGQRHAANNLLEQALLFPEQKEKYQKIVEKFLSQERGDQ